MSLDVFERRTSYVATFLLLVSPIPTVATILLFSDGRVLKSFFGILYFAIGVTLKIGLRRFRTNLRSGLSLIERCFYLGSAIVLASFVYMCLSNLILFSSVIGVIYVLASFIIVVVCFLAIKKTIDEIKAQNLDGLQE
jgi:hypothetical protein